MNNSAAQKFDVIIVGAGLAGSALACAIAQGDSSLKLALIEAQEQRVEQPDLSDGVDHYDPRVSALTLATQRLLAQIGVWPQIEAQRVAAYKTMQVWDAEGTGEVSFDASAVNQACLGYIVENRISLAALLARLNTLDNVQRFNLCKVAGLSMHEQQRELQLADGRRLSAPLIVAADGANSFIRRQAGFTMREWDYHHHAIVATVQTEKAHGYSARQSFLPQGPLAFLPLADSGEYSGHYCSIVWSAVPDYAEQLMALSDEAFSQQLAEALEYRLGKVTALSKRFSFPLRQRHAVDYVLPGLALIGDAAHTIHPLAGQGINLGFSDVAVLAEEILRARTRDLPLADMSILQRYQRRRKSDNLTMMAAMEGFKQLFSQQSLVLRCLRNSGMHWFDRSAMIKRQVMKAAMGLA